MNCGVGLVNCFFVSSPSLPWQHGRRQQGWFIRGTQKKQFTKPTPQLILGRSIAIFKITFPILERSPISEIVPYNVCCGGKLTNKDVKPANNASRRAGAAAAGAGGDLSAAMAALHVGGHGGGASAASASTGSANEITLFIYQKHQCVQ